MTFVLSGLDEPGGGEVGGGMEGGRERDIEREHLSQVTSLPCLKHHGVYLILLIPSRQDGIISFSSSSCSSSH